MSTHSAKSQRPIAQVGETEHIPDVSESSDNVTRKDIGRVSQAPEKVEAPLGKKTASGFMLMSGQSLVTRVFTLVASFVLAKVLLPNDFTLFAVAMGVVSFVTLLQQIGIREILVARQKRFDRWASVGVWISVVVSVACLVGIALCAPVAAWAYQDQRYLGLMLVLAITQPMYSLTIVHEAKLQIDLRFKALAGLNLVQGMLVPVLMVAFALLGAGAYSFVLPRLVAGIVRILMLLAIVRVPFSSDPQVRLWKYIILPGMVIFLTAIVNNIGSAAPALILGKIGGENSAGYFALAFNITAQGVILLATTLDNVLFPTLGRLQGEPDRQRHAYLRATRSLAAISVPMCVLQAILIRPLFELFYDTKWSAAIVPAQILSIGMIYLSVFIPAGSLLMASSRFRTRLRVGTIWALAFLVGALVGATYFGAVGVALALALAYVFSGVHLAAEAIRPIGGGWFDAVEVLFVSHVVGGLSAIVGVSIAWVMPSSSHLESIVGMLAVATGFSVVYLALLRLMARAVWTDLVQSLAPIVSILRRKAGNA